MRKHKLKRSVFVVASTSLLLLSSTAFNAAAEPPIVHDEEVSNNLSVPAIFAEGHGITGLKAVDDESTGLPGRVDDPFWGTPVYYDYDGEDGIENDEKFYLQALDSTWMAQWAVANTNDPSEKVKATVDWSDSVISGEWNYKSVIPIGVTLYYIPDPDDTSPPDFYIPDPETPTKVQVGDMFGYQMFDLPAWLYPEDETSSLDEDGEEEEVVYGTNKDTNYPGSATVYTVCARLTIQKFKDCPPPEEGEEEEEGPCFEDEPVFDSAVWEGFGVHAKPTWYLTTIDGPGKIVYFFNWNLAREQLGKDLTNEGSYRLTFSIDDATDEYKIVRGPTTLKEWGAVSSNVILLDTLHSSDAAGPNVPVYVSESEMYVDVEISPEMGD